MSNNKVVKQLQKMAKKDPQAKVFFEWLASYSNDRIETSVDYALTKITEWVKNNLQNEPLVLRGDIIRIMKSLDELEVGQFFNGRRGALSRFEFWAHRAEVGKVAIGETNELIIEEDNEEIDEDEIIEIHRRLIAYALDKPASTVRIKIKGD